jgi:hypothetical protein
MKLLSETRTGGSCRASRQTPAAGRRSLKRSRALPGNTLQRRSAASARSPLHWRTARNAEARRPITNDGERRPGTPTMHNGLEKLTIREWESALGTLHGIEFDKIEKRVWDTVARLASEALSLIEQREPGYMADRIVSLGDLYPLRVRDVPPYMTGGKDLLDIAAEDGNSSLRHIIAVVWPRVRQSFRDQLRLYFSRLAVGGGHSGLVECRHRSRHERERDLATCLRYLCRPDRNGVPANGVAN